MDVKNVYEYVVKLVVKDLSVFSVYMYLYTLYNTYTYYIHVYNIDI